MKKIKAVIIGGGSAGMTCALKLKENNIDYLLITDTLGGRICYSEDEKVNFGAYFVMQTYPNAKKLVSKETRINPVQVLFHNSDTDYFSTISAKSLSLLPQLSRFYFQMQKFMKHYGPFKINCETMPQREAMSKDPYIEKLFNQSATEYVIENKLEKVAYNMISKFTYACTGVDMDKLIALDFLNVCQGLVIPIHRFKFDKIGMENRLKGHLMYDSVISFNKVEKGYELLTKTGEKILAENIVLATPASVTQKLLNLETPLRKTAQLYVSHVKATMLPKFDKYKMNVFPFESEIVFTAIQDDGSYLFYTREKDADLKKVCSQYTLIGKKEWEKAMYVYGDAYVEQEYEKGLYVAGDHNGLGLEPTAISGIYAANQIIKSI